MNRRSLIAIVCCNLLIACSIASAADTSSVDFHRDIAPIFASRCLECHGEQEPEGGLRLTSRANALARSDSGEPSVVPGDAAASELLRRVTTDDDERMPPDGERLSHHEVTLLTRWIENGASWPESSDEPMHWAYRRPKRPPLPEVEPETWIRNPIDAFVLDRHQSHNPALSPSPMAAPAKLLRRVYLDLIGLPPSIGEIDRFLADPSQQHYEVIVDELLASPHYGEKWARSWLDLARYADSNGFQADQFREIWAYRDWIIRAMNDDMPFDQFTIEQLAGDLLPDPTPDQKIATGFQRCTTCNVEAGVDPEENRINQVVDRVNTFGTVWLGTTLECAQCHNHKYDPFTQQDYYELLAFFNNTPLEVERPNGKGVQYEVAGPKMDLPLDAELRRRTARLEEQLEDLETRIAARRRELKSSRDTWLAGLESSLGVHPTWHETLITSFESAGGANFERLDDRSLVITGPNPSKDTYTVVIETKLAGITGLKIEMLAHDSLPGRGPGRASPRPNSIINEIEVVAQPIDGKEPQPVALHSATAGFSQKNWDVSGAIDGDPKSGWAINPKFGEDHWATFLTAEPVGWDAGTRLVVKIHQNYGGSRTIGRLRLSLMTGDPGAESLPSEIREILSVDDAARREEQRDRLTTFHEDSDPVLSELFRERAELSDELEGIAPNTTLVMVEMDQPRETAILKRGNFLEPLVAVEPATPDVLHPLNPDRTEKPQADRLDLATWLVSGDNPLIARVTVNRWWAEIFGRGIVGTPEDFGTQGDLPTHPRLLDWLAVEFMENGWSMKHIHRLIVTSSTYRQDSRVTPELHRLDPYNTMLTRGPRFRLPAESLRDNGLKISGLLSTKIGGPPVYPPQPPKIWRHVGRNAPEYKVETDEDRFRRGLYVVWRRSAPYPSFVNFDAPDRGACVVKRSRTNTPLQALTLLNDPAYAEMAAALADRLLTEFADNRDRERVEYGFRLCTSRQPTTEETDTLHALYRLELDRYRKDPQAAKRLSSSMASSASPEIRAAWFCVANALLNLDETVTKE